MYMSKQLSDREIDAILFQLRDRLGWKERKEIKAALREARYGGALYPEGVRKALRRLREGYKISSGDADAVEAAIFGE